MYVKYEYRGKGYSKLLNDAILKEAKNLGYDKVYLKSDLIDYYENFDAKWYDINFVKGYNKMTNFTNPNERKKWTTRYGNWNMILSELSIMFDGRI